MKKFKVDQKQDNFNPKRPKIVINNTILTPDFKLEGFRHSNLDGLESESLMIQFPRPNGLSRFQGSELRTEKRNKKA